MLPRPSIVHAAPAASRAASPSLTRCPAGTLDPTTATSRAASTRERAGCRDRPCGPCTDARARATAPPQLKAGLTVDCKSATCRSRPGGLPRSRRIVVRGAGGVQGEPVRGPQTPHRTVAPRAPPARPWTPPPPRPNWPLSGKGPGWSAPSAPHRGCRRGQIRYRSHPAQHVTRRHPQAPTGTSTRRRGHPPWSDTVRQLPVPESARPPRWVLVRRRQQMGVHSPHGIQGELVRLRIDPAATVRGLSAEHGAARGGRRRLREAPSSYGRYRSAKHSGPASIDAA